MFDQTKIQYFLPPFEFDEVDSGAYNADHPTQQTEYLSGYIMSVLRSIQGQNIPVMEYFDRNQSVEEDVTNQVSTILEAMGSTLSQVADYWFSTDGARALPVPIPAITLPAIVTPTTLAVWAASMIAQRVVGTLIQSVFRGISPSGEEGGVSDELLGMLGDIASSVSNISEELLPTLNDALEQLADSVVPSGELEGIDGEVSEYTLYDLLQRVFSVDRSGEVGNVMGIAEVTRLLSRVPLLIRVNNRDGVGWDFSEEELQSMP